MQLQWASYYDAADEAGVSRRWGGIHPEIDDLPGRVIGSECGKRVWSLAPKYWNASILDEGMAPRISRISPTGILLTWDTSPGLWYEVRKSLRLSSWTTVAGPIRANDIETSWIDETASKSTGFYRVIQTEAP